MAVMTKDKSFYKALITLAIPISLQNLITYGVNFADNVMIGSLGDNAISGVCFFCMFWALFLFQQLLAILRERRPKPQPPVHRT